MKRALWVCWIVLLTGLAVVVLRRETPSLDVAELTSARRVLPSQATVAIMLPAFEDAADSLTPQETRYRFDLPELLDHTQALGIYLPRFTANVAVYYRGRMLGTTRLRDNPAEAHLQEPFLVQLPSAESVAGDTFEVGLSSPHAIVRSMGTVFVGRMATLSAAYDRRLFMQRTGVYALTILFFAASAMAFLFWYADQSYRSPLWFGWFSLLLVPVAIIGLLTTIPPFEWPLYHNVASLSLALSAAALAQFVFEKTGARRPWTDQALATFAIVAVVLLPLLYESRLPSRYAKVVDFGCLVIGVIVVSLLVRAYLKHRDSLSFVLLTGCLLTLGLGVHSLLTAWHPDYFMDICTLAYAPLPLMFAMGWVIIRRYARIRLRTEAMNKQLARKIARREREVARAYQRLSELESDRAVRAERDRFMRDMHDGLGTQLITSMRMAENNQLTSGDMSAILQECIDELRLSIEAMKPTGDDLFATLANFRYRIEPRLEAARIALKWTVQPAKDLPPDSSQVLQVMRIASEAITNALKHSGTETIYVRGEQHERHYLLSIGDSGTGFSTKEVGRGDGLANMKHRAESIGAKLDISSGRKGTTVALRLLLLNQS
jgi:signal transduction histidine kinase